MKSLLVLTLISALSAGATDQAKSITIFFPSFGTTLLEPNEAREVIGSELAIGSIAKYEEWQINGHTKFCIEPSDVASLSRLQAALTALWAHNYVKPELATDTRSCQELREYPQTYVGHGCTI